VVPLAAPLIEPVEGEVLVAPVLEELVPDVSELVEPLPVVPDVEPDEDVLPIDEEALPIIALVSVHAPLEPCRQPVSVMLFEEPVALWSMLPDVPVLLGDEVDGSCGGVLLPGCPVEPDCAASVTANAQAMATLDAVVTTRFIS
jgi:hypothetical protein